MPFCRCEVNVFVFLQAALQFSFQRSIPEAHLASDHVHDNKNDHRVSSSDPDHQTVVAYLPVANIPVISVHPLCTSSSTVALLQLISRGSPMSFEDSNRIIPLFYLFSSLFSHSLISVHDSEFFGHEIEGTNLFVQGFVTWW